MSKLCNGNTTWESPAKAREAVEISHWLRDTYGEFKSSNELLRKAIGIEN